MARGGRKERRYKNRSISKNTDSTTPPFNESEDYWHEISAKCVDGESLRLQQKLLRQANKMLELTNISDSASVHVALENVHILAERVRMLQGR
jgi:hypothetical protein